MTDKYQRFVDTALGLTQHIYRAGEWRNVEVVVLDNSRVRG